MVTKTALPIVTALLLISLAGNWYFWQSAKDEQLKRLLDNGKAQVVIAAKTAEILKADTVIQAIRTKVRKDSLETSRVVVGLKTRVSTLRLKLAELGEVTPQEDTTCARLITVSLTKDSIIQAQDTVISTLELHHAAQVVDLEAIIFELQTQNLAQAAISDAWRETAVSAQADVKKEKQGKKLWQWVAGGATAISLYLALKE